LKGSVFDVSNADFYKPGGPYHVLAGHDASVALARMNLDPEVLNNPAKYNWRECLNEEEKQSLENWFKRLSDKYPVVGTLEEISI